MEAPEVHLTKVTLNLVEGDRETLSAYYPHMGWSVAARELINRYCTQLRVLERQNLSPRPIEVTLPSFEHLEKDETEEQNN